MSTMRRVWSNHGLGQILQLRKLGRRVSPKVLNLLVVLALLAVLFWNWFSDYGSFRLLLTVTVLPGVGAAICLALFFNTSDRLLHPPDVGSEGKEVVDLEQEAREAQEGARPDGGSSSSRRSGRCASASTRPTRARCPRESDRTRGQRARVGLVLAKGDQHSTEKYDSTFA